jgi:hypothetical protein
MSSAVHLLTVRDHCGHRRQAVLRRYVLPEHAGQDPDAARREARALRIVRHAGVPTPVLLAADPAGTGDGVPAVLMSRLPGRVNWWPSDMERWLRHLAGLLPRIHAAPLPPAGVLRPFAPYPQASYRPPGWARYPRVWERAAEISHGPPAATAGGTAAPRLPPRQRAVAAGHSVRGGRLQDACTGPAAADVAHCRVNLLTFGTETAERFTAFWQQAAGAAYHPWGDVVTIIGFLDDLRDGWGPERNLVEDLLARAIAELGGNSR